MGLLSKLKAELSEETDSIKGEIDSVGGFKVHDSNVYDAEVKVAYLTVSKGGANGLVLHFELDTGDEYRTTEWVTSGTAKGCKPYSTNAKGDKRYMQGYLNADALCLFSTGKGILEQQEKKLTFELWDKDTKQNVPQEVDAVPALIGKKVKLGIQKILKNKNVQGNNGSWVPTAETREENEINKVFNTKGFTTTEVTAMIAEPVFINTWLDKFQGVVVDKTDKSLTAAPAGNIPAMKGEAGTMFK